ncbi:hypothetical protein LRR81_08395 [Metabacillus sp. GX 13764]|uniref:hypothetical protein n=1 Tax=Metabacillus kandeliae TaxID=2900151 RepID=UPI001E2A9213|nr:hypothetical protein [Metabacillus kandeliae]MCD7034252.1 hypothetical protein [Metabacillus kandeliae]
MSLTLLTGFLGVLLILFFKSPLGTSIQKSSPLVSKLKNAQWFQNHWFSGVFLFLTNAALFFLTCLLLLSLMFFTIPYLHLAIMLAAVIASIFIWMVISAAWNGSRKNRFIMSTVGSSFYLILAALFIYWFVTLTPSYQGDDTFMRAIGLLFASIVTCVAFAACLIITGFSKTKKAE